MILTQREFQARQEWVKKHLLYVAVPVVDAVQGGGSGSSVAVPGAPVLSIDSYPTSSSVIVSWTEPSGSPTRYNIYVDGVFYDYTEGLSSAVSGLTLGVPTEIYVTAVNAGGEGDPSNTVTADTSDYFPTVTNSRLWLSRDRNLYTDTAGTTPAAVNDNIASWRAVGGDWGTDLLTQATGSKRPVRKSDGIQADGVDDYFDASILLNSDYTMYFVVTSVNSAAFTPMAQYASSYGYFGGGGSLYYSNGLAWSEAAGYWNGGKTEVVRFRSGGGTLYAKLSGGAEQSSSVAAVNATLNRIMSASNGSMDSTGRFHQAVIVTKLITPGDADDLAIIAKLQELEPTAVWS